MTGLAELNTSELVKLEVEVHPDFRDVIDYWCERWGYETRDEFIRGALRSLVETYEKDEVAKTGKRISYPKLLSR